jgi:hypothetical protein
VLDFVKEFFSDATLHSDQPAEAVIALASFSTGAASTPFGPFFDRLGPVLKDNNISGFSLSLTTLEEVFLSLQDLKQD